MYEAIIAARYHPPHTLHRRLLADLTCAPLPRVVIPLSFGGATATAEHLPAVLSAGATLAAGIYQVRRDVEA